MNAFASAAPDPTAAHGCREDISRIDADLERCVLSRLLNERDIEAFWSAAHELDADRPAVWLLMARVAEAALICAGRYAESCEFEAAGDFLVNPREILLHRASTGRKAVKERHARLSDQFGLDGLRFRGSRGPQSGGLRPEITKPPLLPLMTRVLAASGRIAPAYLRRLEAGQRRIADVLNFLAAWRIRSAEDLRVRLRKASVRDRAFAEAHLCRFGTRLFHRLGADLRRNLSEPDAPSLFLARSPGGQPAMTPFQPETHDGR